MFCLFFFFFFFSFSNLLQSSLFSPNIPTIPSRKNASMLPCVSFSHFLHSISYCALFFFNYLFIYLGIIIIIIITPTQHINSHHTHKTYKLTSHTPTFLFVEVITTFPSFKNFHPGKYLILKTNVDRHV